MSEKTRTLPAGKIEDLQTRIENAQAELDGPLARAGDEARSRKGWQISELQHQIQLTRQDLETYQENGRIDHYLSIGETLGELIPEFERSTDQIAQTAAYFYNACKTWYALRSEILEQRGMALETASRFGWPEPSNVSQVEQTPWHGKVPGALNTNDALREVFRVFSEQIIKLVDQAGIPAKPDTRWLSGKR